jgi:hypothetical protein
MPIGQTTTGGQFGCGLKIVHAFRKLEDGNGGGGLGMGREGGGETKLMDFGA